MTLTYEQILELDAARTPGTLRRECFMNVPPQKCAIVLMNKDSSFKEVICEYRTNDKGVNPDIAYLTAMPQAVALLRQQHEELGRLREALEFYADKNSYLHCQISRTVQARPISIDNGQRARQALATDGVEG